MRRKVTNEIVTAADLQTISGWDKLETADRSTVLVKTQAIANALKAEGQSRLEVGKNLAEAREILLPLKIWVGYLRTAFHMSERTGYRYIQEYEDKAKVVPSNVLDISMARGYKTISKTSGPDLVELVKRNPPPRTEDPKRIVQYLDTLEESPPIPRARNVVMDAYSFDDRLKICFRIVASHYDKLVGKREKDRFARTLIGMELTKFGITADGLRSATVPEGFTARGRPRERKAA